VRSFAAILFSLILSGAIAQRSQVLPPQKINKLVPTKIKGYSSKGEPKSSQVKIGTITYSMCERTFASGHKNVRILMFDYEDAPIMFTQAMKKWGEVKLQESDSIVFRPFASPQVDGWESYTRESKHAQLILGINGRFFLTLSGENLELNELKGFLDNFDFEKFPK
jgi:hypothetical protein